MEILEIDGSNQIWSKIIKSILQNINLLTSFALPFQKCRLLLMGSERSENIP